MMKAIEYPIKFLVLNGNLQIQIKENKSFKLINKIFSLEVEIICSSIYHIGNGKPKS